MQIFNDGDSLCCQCRPLTQQFVCCSAAVDQKATKNSERKRNEIVTVTSFVNINAHHRPPSSNILLVIRLWWNNNKNNKSVPAYRPFA